MLPLSTRLSSKILSRFNVIVERNFGDLLADKRTQDYKEGLRKIGLITQQVLFEL